MGLVCGHNPPVPERCLHCLVGPGGTVNGVSAARPMATTHSLPVVRPPCIHEGPVVESCVTCGNKEDRHVRMCTHPDGDRDKCTRAHPNSLYQRCDRCPQYEPPSGVAATVVPSPAIAPAPPVGRRHLVYHLLPVSGNGVWQDCVQRLCLRWPLFTGRKIVAVMTGGPIKSQDGGKVVPLDSLDSVRRRLPPDAEIIPVSNDPARWELASWPHLWGRVLETAGPRDAILYAHAKGVTRPNRISMARYDGTPQLWSRLLYDLALDYWPEVEQQFRAGFPAVGPLRKPGTFFNGSADAGMRRSAWHYSGNIWWARAGDVKERLKRTPVPVDPWGTEAWVGIAYGLHEAGIVGPDLGQSDMYSAEYWNDRVVPAVASWKASHPPTPLAYTPALRQANTVSPTLSIVIPTSGRPTLDRTLATLRPQLSPGDEILVERDDSREWGASARMRAIGRASGDYLAFMDDDDVFTPDGLATIRAALRVNPGRPHLFQMRYSSGRVLWDRREVAEGNVSTVQFVTPLAPASLGIWGTRYEGDYDFIKSTCDLYPDGPIWVPTVTALVRPPE